MELLLYSVALWFVLILVVRALGRQVENERDRSDWMQ